MLLDASFKLRYVSSTADAERSGVTRRTGPSKTRVLVVEDEQDIAGLIKHALERDGDMSVESSSAATPPSRRPSSSAPDLIILDLNLPVLSGLEVCRIAARASRRPSTFRSSC